MRIKSKILLPFSLVILLFILFYFIFRIAENNQINSIVNDKIREQKSIFSDALYLKSNLLKSALIEHRSSKEVLQLLKTQKSIPSEDIENILKNFNLSALWIFDSNNKLVLSDFNKKQRPVIQFSDKVFELLKNSNEGPFYLMTDDGLIELFGSVIKTDYNNKSEKEKGYFIVGKMWDKNYVNEIENILKAELIIQKPNDIVNVSDISSIILTSKLFNDWNQQPVAKILVKKQHATLNKLKDFNFFIAVFLGIFIMVMITIIIISFNIFITDPLRKIEHSLNSEDIEALMPLINKGDEFGKISKLIVEFFKQRKQLYDEINEKRITEKALRESEFKYKYLLDNINHGVFRSTQEGKFIEVNKSLVTLLGYSSEEELKSIDLSKDFYFFPVQRRSYLNRLNTDGELLNVELNVKCKDGQMKTCLLNAHLIKENDNKIVYYEGTITDISEYKNLKSHLQKLELAVSQTIDGVALIDKNRNFEYVNEAWANMHGYQPKELIGKNICICHDKPEIMKEEIEPSFEEIIEKEQYVKEIRHTHKDGTVFLTSMSNTVIKDWGGNIIGYVIIASDLSERIKKENEIKALYKELEQKIFEQNQKLNDANIQLHKTIENLEIKEKEISKSQELYLATINSSNEWIFYIDYNYKFVLVNDAIIKFHNSLGIETNLIGKSIKEVYYFMNKKVFDEYEYVFETGKELITEDDNLYGNKFFSTETIKTPVYERDMVVGVVTIVRDITERKEMERKILLAVLEAEEKEKKRFSEDLHDELGALLSTMKIYVNTILKKHTISEAQDLLFQLKEMIYEAVDNTRNIAFNLTPNILVDFGLSRAIKTYCDKINNSQNIQITYIGGEFYEKINKSTEINLFRIVQELISNSLKHSGASNIKIKLDIKDNNLNLLYVDDGKGFDKDKILSKNINGIGINNIFARVKLLNGVCKLESNKGKGMLVEIEVKNIS